MAVEVGEAYVSIIPSARGFGQAVADQTDGPSRAAGLLAGDSFGASLLEGLKKHAGKIAAAISIGAAVKLGKEIFDLGATFDDAFDKIRVTTGKTGTELAGLQDSFKQVFSDVPTDADSASSAVATLNQKLGLTGKPLEALSKQLLNLSRITGTDLNANMSAAVDVFNSFGISAAEQPAKLDELFRASQKTGVSVDDLASTMAQAGPNLKQLGLNFEQSAGLVAIFGKAGVDVGAVLPALSKTIVQASKDGKNAGDVFRETFDRIRNAPSDTEAAGAAIDVFGARAGPKLAGLIREGKLGYEELATAIAQGGDTINGAAADTADFAEQWGTFKNQVLVGLEPLATKVFGAVGDAMAAIGPKVGPAIAAVTDGLTGLFDGGEQAISAFVAAFKAGGDDITSSGFNGVAEGIGLALRDVYDWLKVKIPEAIDALKAAFDTAQTAISTTVGYVDDHKDAFATITTGVLGFAAALQAVTVAQTGVAAVSNISALAASLAPLLLAAGPIGLVIAAIVAVGAAAFVAYQQFEPFRNVVDAVGRVIRDVAIAAFNALVVAAVAVANFVGTAFDAVRGAVDTVAGAFTTFGQIVSSLFSVVVAALTPLAQWFNDNVVSTLNAGLELIIAVFQRVSDMVSAIVSTMIAIVQPALVQMQVMFEVFSTVATTVVQVLAVVIADTVAFWVAAFRTFIDVVAPIWEVFFQNILTVAQTVIGIILAVIETVLGVIRGVFQVFTGLVSGDWSKLWEGIQTIASSLFGGVIGILSSIWSGIQGLFSNAIEGIKSTVSNGFGAVVDFVSGIPGRIASALGSLGGILVGAGRSLLQGLIDGIEGMAGAVVGAVRGVVDNAIAAIPGVGGILSAIPHLAGGGLVTRPTVALIGEAGPEAVIPLSMFNQGVQFGQYPELAEMPVTSDATAGSPTTINVYPSPFARPADVARELAAEQRWQRIGAGV